MASPFVYINSLGRFLPGPAIPNDQMEDFLGTIGGRPSRFKSAVLRQNGIISRHYALGRTGKITHRVAELAALAAKEATASWTGSRLAIDFLAAATSQGDSLLPSFASAVHGELKLKPCEITSVHGACASSLIALRAAQLALIGGGRNTALVCAGELPSRFFRPGFLGALQNVIDGSRTDTDIEFLRWMLSDGGSAAILEKNPNEKSLSLRVDWIDIRSYASEYPTCMYAGARKAAEQTELAKFWYEYKSVEDAVRDGALTLRQDMRLLENIIKVGIRRYFELIDRVIPVALRDSVRRNG